MEEVTIAKEVLPASTRTPAAYTRGRNMSVDDKDGNIRWLAGSSLVRFGGKETVAVLSAYLEGAPTPEGRMEAERVLGILGEVDRDA